MTDLSKCEGTNCDCKDKCYRYTCPTNPYRQYWGDFKTSNLNYGKETCEWFLPLKDKNKS